MPKKYIIALIILFLLSVAVRLVNINRPLSKHHEFNTAMILNVCNSWEKAGGPQKFNFTPVTYFGNEGDRYYGEHSMMAHGKLYYASMGPMQFVLPYYLIKIFGMPITVLHVELLAVLMHLVLIILFLTLLIFVFKKHDKYEVLVFSGTSIFMFLPNYLWFFSNAFSHESLVLIFYLWFLIALYQNNIYKRNINLFIATFLGVLTDWFMVVVVVIFILHSVIMGIKNKDRKNIYNTLIVTISCFIAILLIFTFFGASLGQKHFYAMFMEKFSSRTASGISSSNTDIFKLLYNMAINFLSGYGAVIFLASFLVFSIIQKKQKFKVNTKSFPIWMMILPPLMFNFLFFEFSNRHDYASMKYAIFIVILISYLFMLFIRINNVKILSYVVSLAILLQIMMYYTINGAFFVVQNNKIGLEKKIGQFITKECINTDHIFMADKLNNYPAAMHYANRNIRFLGSEPEIIQHVKEFEIKNAILVWIGEGDSVMKKYIKIEHKAN